MNENIKRKLHDLPEQSGVYMMKDSGGAVIYVGKAVVLKNRVRQYFHSSHKPEKVEAMVSHIEDLDYIITNSETDALMLESNLIKKYKPQYNILLKDDKNYPYIRIDLRETYPRVTIVRKLQKDGAKYFGPYMGLGVKDLLELIHAAFPIRSCAHALSNVPKKGARACLNAHIGRCSAPCKGGISPEAYGEVIRSVMAFLGGDDSEISDIFRSKMSECSAHEEYESAILYRDRLVILDKIKLRKVAAFSHSVSLDCFAIRTNGSYAAVAMLVVRDGKMVGVKNYPLTDASLDPYDTFRNFLTQYYSDTEDIPPEILVNISLPDADSLSDLFQQSAGRKVQLHCPKQGAKVDLKRMAERNAEDYLLKSIEKMKRQEELTVGALGQLKEVLKLESIPMRMECYDISNISGTDKTASMVVFKRGEPDKSSYRRFKIKTVEGANDFASMKEVLFRRLLRAKSGDVSFTELPDLIVVDGGKGQLSYAKEAMNEADFDIPLISLAERDEEIYTLNNPIPIVLPKSNLALRLMQRIRDEAHRFAITYHRSLREKRFDTALSEVFGIGKTRRIALLKVFKSVDQLKQASISDLMQVEGISRALAERILEKV